MNRTDLQATGRRLVGIAAAVAVLAATISGTVARSDNTDGGRAQAWSFGVMDDTQWTASTDPAKANPNAVAVSIINQVNPQFVKAGVKFVIQVGDLTANGNDADIAARAAAAKPLLNAGIGFFPMRGNHETYGSPANSYGIPEIQKDFPQTRGWATPSARRTSAAPRRSAPTSTA